MCASAETTSGQKVGTTHFIGQWLKISDSEITELLIILGLGKLDRYLKVPAMSRRGSGVMKTQFMPGGHRRIGRHLA